MEYRMYRFASGENPDDREIAAPITEQEATAFAAALAEAVGESNCEPFLQLVDWERIFDRATAVPALPELEEQRQHFKAQGLARVRRDGAIHEGLYGAVQQGASYKPLRIGLSIDNSSVLFRLNLPHGGGLNYHQYTLVRNRDGGVVADDVFVFLDAESLSHSFRRAWLPIAKVALKESCGEFAEPDDAFLIHVDDVLTMNALVDDGRHVEALELYRSFPEALRTNRSLMANALTAAQGVSDEDYTQVINEFRRMYPYEPALDLMLMDGYALRKKYGMALRCVERLNKLVGGDPLLSAKRAACLLQLGRIPEAREAIEKAIREDPDEIDGYSIGLDVALAERNFDDVVRHLMILEACFGFQWGDLEESYDFSEFVESPQYEAWLTTDGE
jgi:tetratricopeptide (TPR) repeat protein